MQIYRRRHLTFIVVIATIAGDNGRFPGLRIFLFLPVIIRKEGGDEREIKRLRGKIRSLFDLEEDGVREAERDEHSFLLLFCVCLSSKEKE
ncbi:unnamed protein product [Linum trigynum]|uniref:Uncharacterized protein n=1 Tax=Linum trigynum TaxID=586398 RepID=A0AAV2FBC8_9ROSI